MKQESDTLHIHILKGNNVEEYVRSLENWLEKAMKNNYELQTSVIEEVVLFILTPKDKPNKKEVTTIHFSSKEEAQNVAEQIVASFKQAKQ